MANDGRHAAWQTERRFAVRILPEDGPPADLASGLTEFLDAFDLASEWVSREDPARDGTASLAIVETQDGGAEEVWTYTPGQPPPADVIPLSWAPVPEFPRRQQKSRLRERVGAAVVIERVPAVVPPSPPQRAVAVARPEPKPGRTAEVAAARESPRQWLRTWVRTAWNDRLARVCLIGSGASLWFSVGLADPHFLLPLLVFLPALWWRDRNRVEPATEAEPEDWL